METDVFGCLDKDYRYLHNYIDKINKTIFQSPESAIITGRIYVENLTKEICRLENYGLLGEITQVERLRKLQDEGVLAEDISSLFHSVRLIGNKVAHDNIEGELEAALNIHKNIFKITCWFVETYVDYKFKSTNYISPRPNDDKLSNINEEKIMNLMSKIECLIGKDDIKNEENLQDNKQSHETDIFEDLRVEDIVNNKGMNLKCLVEELNRLKESSKEAVEALGEFTPFKRYMHVGREVEEELEQLIFNANKSDKAQLILVCGSVGDGKSHVISHIKSSNPDIIKNFTLHNDATESFEPNKTSVDTLNDVLDNFSDEKIGESKQKLILAINLGTLNNFIDSKYTHRFSILKEYVKRKKILDNNIIKSEYDSESSIQFVNFSDYHLFTLKDEKIHSVYIGSLIDKITNKSENNIFYDSYIKYCSQCSNNKCCPIKINYELLSDPRIKLSIVSLLVQCIIKRKIIISTRALLNFIYELIVPISYIDINSPMFKDNIYKLNNGDFIRSLLPNMIFEHKELSFIFDALNSLDPLNIRNEKVDEFIIEFNNSYDKVDYFKKHISCSDIYIPYIVEEKINEKGINSELLKLFIRNYYISGGKDLFSLSDDIYDSYIKNLYYWNKGDKLKLKSLYDYVKQGIMRWNGEAAKDQLNIFIGNNQNKYKVSESIELKVDTSSLPSEDSEELKRFVTTLKLKYKSENVKKAYEIDIDFPLYKLLNEVINGYRPNKKDKNHFIKFVEFISKLESMGSQKEELIFTEKNRNINNKYKLEYDSEFEIYRFMEI